jgi:hypothetical protein
VLLRVTVPSADPSLRSGRLTQWHVKEGDPISFGDYLCNIAIDHFIALQRTKRATLLGSTSKRRQRRIHDGYDAREGRGMVRMNLRSAERFATMGRILVSAGDRVAVGQPVAVLVVGEEPTSWDATADDADLVEARVSVDVPEPGEVEEM